MEKMWRLIGVIGILIGIIIMLTPFKLAPVCSGTLELASGMFVPMKCNWTGHAEVIIGAIVAVNGLLIFFAARQNPRYLGLMLGVLGIAAIAIPSNLGIGVCMNPEMSCHTTKSVITMWGGLLIFLGIAGQFTHLLPWQNESQQI
ncbi:MAG: DUF4418 family protein [Bacillota bacterium]|nr:DUF4418 family protein [Bacillota bacterium]